MTRNDNVRFAPVVTRAFTLVELIIVMALLATIMALSAPSLSRSLRGRNLDQEAKRFIALTEYARQEAVSQGVPMVVWIDPEAGQFGVEPKTGYPAMSNRVKNYKLNDDVHFEVGSTASRAEGVLQAVELAPDGMPEPTSIASLRLVDRFESAVAITKTRDGWGYEIVKAQEEK